MNVEKILISIRSLLMDPNINSPANRDASKLFKENYSEYCKRVRNKINSEVGRKK
jgi:ubiquitin-protein ligase